MLHATASFIVHPAQKTNAARGQPPQAALFRGSLSSCLPAARSGKTTVPVRQRSRECHFYRYDLQSRDSWNRVFATCATAGSPTRPRAGSGGGRNARATSTRSRAFPISPGNSPSRIASCHQRHRNHRLTSFESSNVFGAPTLRENVARRNRKTACLCEQAVEDETWLWKAEENAGEIQVA